jgi:hypothetical protein
MFLPLYFCGPAMPANVRLSPDSDRSAGRLDDASTMLNDIITERHYARNVVLKGRTSPAVASEILWRTKYCMRSLAAVHHDQGTNVLIRHFTYGVIHRAFWAY